ncbi:ExeM/NucH family extracellular endonuclease [Glaciihabitans tibetensis]|uniref:ExeM/NucH family extracellular endonuclease n=1 Tax=Glaciihabitans tibetensis TaxID=1266600 RepID=UPI000D0850EA|nr:ExeM/NucH family extracellular endonuclease [Glaciihabitans tibetensis]
MTSTWNRSKVGIAGFLGLALAAAPLVALPASANTAGTGVVINEAYLNGGSAGATYLNKFVELYNPTTAAIDLSGMSLQYRPATRTDDPSGVVALTGTIPAGGYYLIKGSSNAANGATLPTEDATFGPSFAAGGGTIFLAAQTTALTAPATGSLVGNPAIVDLLGYGTSNTFEGTAATAASVTSSLNRAAAVDTDVNSADFTTMAPTPQGSTGSTPTPAPTGTPTATPTVTPTGTPTATPTVTPTPGAVVPINAIQGTTDTSPLAGQTVTTRGVVTAKYATGGYNGYYIQTPGTGGAIDLATHVSSDAVFVFSAATVAAVTAGSYIEVTGRVSEYTSNATTYPSTLTQLAVTDTAAVTVLSESVVAPTPANVAYPSVTAQRESLEGMLLAPTGRFTVTDTYGTNAYGSVQIVQGDSPLKTPTAVVEPGSAEYRAMVADNENRIISLDDGSSGNYTTNAAIKGTPLPYVSTTSPVRVGAAVSFTSPVILDYRYGAWSFQPLSQLTGANAATVQPATFANTRTATPDDVGGDATLASFNVLNYFSTTGDELTGCRYYEDRAGNKVTVRDSCAVRGAAEEEDFQRQQAKIVAAINALGADVVSLEEIENSAALGKTDRDEALKTLTAALNAAAGAGTWSYVRSPAVVGQQEDVIRTAFIYKPAVVETVGASVIKNDPAFTGTARQPLAQAFKLVGGGDDTAFLAIVNHFKSKSTGPAGNTDIDTGDGQGAYNRARVAQAKVLVDFAAEMKTSSGIDRVFLTGDFNAYLKEDPIDVLTAAGYVSLGSTTGEETYSFGGAIGSLDHIFASAEAVESVNDVDIWNINSVESIALEYSRHNYNVTNFYEPNAFRSSDHDPALVGLNLIPQPVDINLLNINDFHGRIDANTVQFAGTVERLRAEAGEENTLFLSAGDNIGASLFASSSQRDEPTIDVLNTLDLVTSAVGNHEFDQGFSDLTGRVNASADFSYLGANVYLKGTTTPALQEYDVFEVDGVRVAVIGAVTEETPTLVSPAGVATLDFGDPVAAVNRVAARLVAGDLADVIVAEYHEGAGAGTPDGATLEEEIALTDSAFSAIVTNTTAEVDAIFTGHTHKQYAWEAQIPNAPAGETRPVLQTGSYGEYIGQIELKFDVTTGEVIASDARNVARPVIVNTPTDKALDRADAVLVQKYPRVAEVKTIVDAALAQAAIQGNVPVGAVTKDITRASTDATKVVEDRASESTLGNLIADSLLSSLSDPDVGGAEIGVVNPGGIRADLLYAGSAAGEGNGVVTYAEANAVLPFVNNLWTTTLTGAQFKTVLEQQWQRNPDGSVPSRPFLNLGLSDNVSYTYDAARAEGDRVTSISIDGAPIVLTRDYRVGSFNFLLQGGDNFREFAKGTDTRDSGLVDRDAWVSYLQENSPIAPSYDRRAVAVTGLPTGVLEAGTSASVTLSKLNLTSLGSPVNTEVTASFEGSSAAAVTAPVASGAATVSFTVPSDIGGNVTLVITAKESGTVVRVPLTLAAIVPDPEPTPGPTPAPTPAPTPDPTPAPTPDPTPAPTPDPTPAPTPDPTPTPEPTPEVPGSDGGSGNGMPANAPVAAGAASLTPELEDDITVSDDTVVAGQTVTLNVGTQFAGQFVSVSLYSAAGVTTSAWLLVAADGTVSYKLPANLVAGEYRLAVQDASGAVIGWTDITATGTGAAATKPGSGSLASTGVDASPALLVALLLMSLGAALAVTRRRRSSAMLEG